MVFTRVIIVKIGTEESGLDGHQACPNVRISKAASQKKRQGYMFYRCEYY